MIDQSAEEAFSATSATTVKPWASALYCCDRRTTLERALDEDEYLSDREQRDIVEREFQTAIEACLDIAALLCKELTGGVPEENASKFGVLAGQDVISQETAERMKQAAGFRNVLAHTYGDDIDDELVYRSLQTDLDWFPTFLRDVRTFLD